MSDLFEQLESYGDQLEESILPVEFEPHEESDRWKFVLAAAAAVVILAGLAVLLFPGDNNATRVITDEIPESTTTIEISTSSTSTTTTEPATTSTAVDPWDDIPGWSGLEFGEVRTIRFEPAFKFVAPEGFDKDSLTTEWWGTAIAPIGFKFLNDANDERGPGHLWFRRLGEDSVEATVALIENSATSVTPPESTTIGGAPAVTFDAEPGEGRLALDDPAGDGGYALNWDFGGTWRFWIVDIDGDVVTIALFEDAAGPGRFGEALELLQPVLDSIEWRDFPREG